MGRLSCIVNGCWWPGDARGHDINYGIDLSFLTHSILGARKIAWWRLKREHFPRYWPFYEGNPLATGGFPSQRLMTRSFDVFCDLRLNKRLRKQSRRRWFKTRSCSLWRHRIGLVNYLLSMYSYARGFLCTSSHVLLWRCWLPWLWDYFLIVDFGFRPTMVIGAFGNIILRDHHCTQAAIVYTSRPCDSR